MDMLKTIRGPRKHILWFLDFLTGIQERMVDALARRGDEGRSVAAIRFGEVPSNL